MAKNVTFKKNSQGFRSVLMSTGASSMCYSKACAIANRANSLGATYHRNAQFSARAGTRSTKRAHAFVGCDNWEAWDAATKGNVLEKSIDAGRS